MTTDTATPDAGTLPPDAPPPDARAEQVLAKVDRGWVWFKAHLVGILNAFRFIFFAAYLILAAVAFWIWFFRALLFIVRTAVRVVMTLLLWIAEGVPQEAGRPRITFWGKVKEECTGRWARRQDAYDDMARPLARHTRTVDRALRRFWAFPVHRKIAVVIFVFCFVYLPGLYVIPRPHYIQLIDDNAIDYDNVNVKYIVHGADLFDYGKTREYVNEDAWWLGKINSQILKNRMQPGRFYKLWVVGIRWWWMPSLYPNIISMTETDQYGVPLAQPSHFIPPTTTGK